MFFFPPGIVHIHWMNVIGALDISMVDLVASCDVGLFSMVSALREE